MSREARSNGTHTREKGRNVFTTGRVVEIFSRPINKWFPPYYDSVRDDHSVDYVDYLSQVVLRHFKINYMMPLSFLRWSIFYVGLKSIILPFLQNSRHFLHRRKGWRVHPLVFDLSDLYGPRSTLGMSYSLTPSVSIVALHLVDGPCSVSYKRFHLGEWSYNNFSQE